MNHATISAISYTEKFPNEIQLQTFDGTADRSTNDSYRAADLKNLLVILHRCAV